MQKQSGRKGNQLLSLTYKHKIPPFTAERMEAIARVLADTNDGLSGSEIANLLNQMDVEDVDPHNTKWKRLFNAFVAFHNKHRVGNHIVVFTTRAMDPAKYTSRPDLFEERRISLNQILAFEGLELGSRVNVRPGGRHDRPAGRQSQAWPATLFAGRSLPRGDQPLRRRARSQAQGRSEEAG